MLVEFLSKQKTAHYTLSRSTTIVNIPKKYTEKLRFVIVGGTNTVIDFSILFFLASFIGLPRIPSNYISTSIAMVFSFYANKNYTFKTNQTSKKHFVMFLLITITGLWIIQPIIIESANLFVQNYFNDKNINLFVCKSIATIVTLIWNYILYRKFVFNSPLDTK